MLEECTDVADRAERCTGVSAACCALQRGSVQSDRLRWRTRSFKVSFAELKGLGEVPNIPKNHIGIL